MNKALVSLITIFTLLVVITLFLGEDKKENDNNDIAEAPAIPLIDAAKDNNIKLVEKLLKTKIDINAKDSNEFTALTYASYKNNLPMVQLLLSKGADPNKGANSPNGSALSMAARHENVKIVLELLKSKAKLEIEDVTGMTPLLIAVKKNNSKLVKIFIDNGANVNAQALESVSALQLAIDNNNPEMISYLIKAGADKNLETMGNQSLIDYAKYKKSSEEIIKLLK